MEKKEYYKRIERINNRFKAGRVSVDESYQLICQRNYLSTKYIKNLEQQCKKQKEVIDKVIMYINLNKQKTICAYGDNEDDDFEIELWEEDIDKLLDILKEVSE